MAKWIKGTEEYLGGEFKFIGEDGNEYVSYHPTDDFLTEQGWLKVDEQEVVPGKKSLQIIKQEILQECNEFYKNSILRVEFRNQFIWVPFETRQAYRVLLDDLKQAGRSQVVFRDITLEISEAIQILKELNLYEYDQKQICDQHIQNIISLKDENELYLYDYTSNYRARLSF